VPVSEIKRKGVSGLRKLIIDNFIVTVKSCSPGWILATNTNRSMVFRQQEPLNRTLDCFVLVGIRLLLPRLESQALTSLLDRIGTSIENELHTLLDQQLRSLLSPAHSPSNELSTVGKEHDDWGRDQPNARERSLITSDCPILAEEVERVGGLVIGNVEGFSVNLGGSWIGDTSKKSFRSKELESGDVAYIDNIHEDVVVAHPDLVVAILQSLHGGNHILEVTLTVECCWSDGAGTDTILAVCLENQLVTNSLGNVVRVSFANDGHGQGWVVFVSVVICSTSSGDDRSRGGVHICLDGSNLGSYFEKILIAFDVDTEGLGDKRVIDVCVRGRSIDDDVRFDLLQDETDLLDVGDVADVVCNAWEVLCSGTTRHNSDRGAAWFIEQELDDMVSEEATATYNEDSTEMRTRRVVCFEAGDAGHTRGAGTSPRVRLVRTY
jgi:hypothetical protein